jgi:hypothetical protein
MMILGSSGVYLNAGIHTARQKQDKPTGAS